MLAIVTRAQIAQFLAKQRHKNDAALGPLGERCERLRNLNYRRCAAGVVIGAVVNVVAFSSAANAQVRGQHQVGVFQSRIGSAQNTDHVAQPDGHRRGRRNVHRDSDLPGSGHRRLDGGVPHRENGHLGPRRRGIAQSRTGTEPPPVRPHRKHQGRLQPGYGVGNAARHRILRVGWNHEEQHLAAHPVRRQGI